MGFLSVLNALSSHASDLRHYNKSFQARVVRIDQIHYSYLNRPATDPQSREIVVFLHGLGSQKEAWVRVASDLCKDYHVLIPDLPGHGKTTPLDPHMNFAADRQARRLHEFFESELYPINKMHLVGICMGATIAGVYAAMYPTRVKSLTLMAPWGISMPTMGVTLSDIDEQSKSAVQSPTETFTSEVGDSPDCVAIADNFVPTRGLFRALVLPARDRARKVTQKVFMDMYAYPTILEDQLHFIRARTLVVWGENDDVLDVSCSQVIDDKLRVTRKHILVLQCGHFVPKDKPAECLDAINKFLADNELRALTACTAQKACMDFS